MDKIICDVQTGQVTIVQMTPEEILDIQATASPPNFGYINSKALIRRRAKTLKQSGQEVAALLLLKTIGE